MLYILYIMKKVLLSIAVWMAGTIVTIILFFAMLFLSVLLWPFDKKRKAAHAQCYWWADVLTGLNPYWDIRVSGLENIDRTKTYVIVANHQSLADIIVMYKTRMQFKWVAKESLFKIPFVGWNMSLARHIKITRGKYSSVKNVYRAAAKWLRDDISVLFFPEGTRSETNEMLEFQNGAFKLAIKERVPILPISLKGTRDAIPKGSWIFTTKVPCRIKVLPAVDTNEFGVKDFAALRDMVRAKLNDAAV